MMRNITDHSKLTPAELGQLRILAEEFFAESKMPGKLDFEGMMTLINGMGKLNRAVMFAHEVDGAIVGVSIGLLGKHPITGDVIMTELVWYVTPSHRGKTPGGLMLLKFLENWGRERGAVRFFAGFAQGLNEERMGELYEGLGYTRMETMYQKPLCQ